MATKHTGLPDSSGSFRWDKCVYFTGATGINISQLQYPSVETSSLAFRASPINWRAC